MFLNVCVKVLGPFRGDISRHFWSAWWPDFGPHRESTVSTALARNYGWRFTARIQFLWLEIGSAHDLIIRLQNPAPAGVKVTSFDVVELTYVC